MENINEEYVENAPHEPFYELRNRLHEFSSSYKLQGTDEHSHKIIDRIITKLNTSNYDYYIGQIEILLKRIDKIAENESNIVKNYRVSEWDKSSPFSFGFGSDNKENLLTKVRTELDIYRRRLQSLSQDLEKRSDEVAVPSKEKPFKTKLSVKELAYLFRALADEGIIDIPKGKLASFSRRVTELFISKSDNIEAVSPKSFRKNYDNVDPKAGKEWFSYFSHLKASAEKYRSEN